MNPDSELLREGYKSYHKAVFTVMEFRRQAGQRFRTLVRGGGLSRCGSATFA